MGLKRKKTVLLSSNNAWSVVNFRKHLILKFMQPLQCGYRSHGPLEDEELSSMIIYENINFGGRSKKYFNPI